MQKVIDSANESTTSSLSPVEEPIDVVIPFKVWSELEHQSKSAEPDNAYAARTAIRMLRDELKSNGIYAKVRERRRALRSQ